MWTQLLFLWATVLAAAVQAQVNLNDLSGGCDPTVNPSEQCGGHGTCFAANLTCACEEWWTTKADFIDSQDCPTSIIAIYVLWSINLLEIMYILYSTTYVLVIRAENFFEQRKVKRDYTLWKNKGLIALIFYFGLGMPTHIIMAVIRLLQPDSRVAFDLFPTVLFFLSKTGFYMASIFLQGPLLAAALRGRVEFNGLIKINYILNIFISCGSILVGSFAFITFDHFQGNLPKQIEVMRAYYLAQASALTLAGIQAYLIKKWVFSALDAARALVSSSDKTDTIKRKIGDLQNQIMKQGLIQGAIYIVMGVVPFFLNKHAYFLPISWLAMPLIGKRLAFQFDLDKAGAKTLAMRLGMKKSSTYDHSATAGSKKKREGEHTQSENPSFVPGSMVASTFGETKPATTKKKDKKAAQVLSVALSDEDSAMQEIMEGEGPLRERFTEFVRGKYASETIALYDACVMYQKLAQTSSSAELNRLGASIIETHVKDTASQPVDMPDDLRRQLLEAESSNNFDKATFDPVKNMAFELLKSNFYQHFAKTLQQ